MGFEFLTTPKPPLNLSQCFSFSVGLGQPVRMDVPMQVTQFIPGQVRFSRWDSSGVLKFGDGDGGAGGDY